MEKLELTSEEKKELEKRGFYVKDLITLFSFLKNIPIQFFFLLVSISLGFLVGWLCIAGGYSEESTIITDSILLSTIPILLLTLKSGFSYIYFSKIFYKDNGTIFFKNISSQQKGSSIIQRTFQKIQWFKSNSDKAFKQASDTDIFRQKNGYGSGVNNTIFGFFIWIFMLGGMMISGFAILVQTLGAEEFTTFMIKLSSLFGLYFGIYFIAIFLHKILEHFHPLYAFGNLGEKIQRLTPEIEEESKIIQVEFERDQNFSVLHSGFEKLSSTFSEIVELVVKLERVEKRANKGNLFDSEKYINSLRGDIVNPLVELKKFLEKQRGQLVESQRELSRVRVGGGEERGNTELSSQRSEIILGELDENIERLEEMIGKL